jgi:V-type H+-transporting ATPase subunit a
VPQVLFLGLLFGYMDFLIIFKWLKLWDPKDSAHPAPSIISTMMDIGLKTGSTEKANAMWGDAGRSSQDSIQVVLLLIAVLCVPIMLLPKPIIEIKRMKRNKPHKHDHLLME